MNQTTNRPPATMNRRIRELLSQITALEDEIEQALRRQEHTLYHLQDGKVHFPGQVEAAQLREKQGLPGWLLDSSPANVLSIPLLYGLFVPMVLMDLCLTLYQWLCFPLYRIGRVKRSNYIVIDRYHLRHLNSIEKLNCIYCGYANGLVAYAREIAARTEQFWCPIKHASRIRDRHARYHDFVEYGDATDYHARLQEYRDRLTRETR